MNKNTCIKCQSCDIKTIKALPVKINPVKMIHPIYYVCTKCGYMELWLNDVKDKEYLKRL